MRAPLALLAALIALAFAHAIGSGPGQHILSIRGDSPLTAKPWSMYLYIGGVSAILAVFSAAVATAVFFAAAGLSRQDPWLRAGAACAVLLWIGRLVARHYYSALQSIPGVSTELVSLVLAAIAMAAITLRSEKRTPIMPGA